MNTKKRTRTSKFLSLVLRHQPEKIGLTLDEAGWVRVDVLLDALGSHGRKLDRESLEEIVRDCPKRRFALSDDGLRIRANQGHSVDVALGYVVAVPPEVLFHGTVARVLPAIRDSGLLKMKRHHVHLSADRVTASQVGSRRGKPVILTVRAGDMARAGHTFHRSDNGVWLTERVPPEFIHFRDGAP